MRTAAHAPSAFAWYLTSSSSWMAAMSLQGFLLSWMLVGILHEPADHVGFARALVDAPSLVVLFVGGMLADRMDGRTLLLRMHVLIALPCIAIALVAERFLSVSLVVAWGMTIAMLQSATDPARQAMLSQVTREHIQRTVTIMTIVTSLVGVGGVWIGGQLERIGLARVLLLQAALFASGAIAVQRMPAMPPSASRAPLVTRGGYPRILSGLVETWRTPLVRNAIGLNFFSSLFNAGAYVVAVPFIVRDVYHGDADFFSRVMIVFTAGSIGSNVALLRFMPLRRPGRLFLHMQLTRIAILAILYVRPSLPIFFATIFAWGVNMGVTSTLVRTTVQELAPIDHRAQVLSVLLFSFLVTAPVSSLLLGAFIADYDPLTGLLPGIAISAVIYVVGILWSGLWGYESVREMSLTDLARS